MAISRTLIVITLAALSLSACSSTRPVQRAAPNSSYFTAPVFFGDTLSTFAERHGVPPNEILVLNKVRQRKSTKHLINGQLKVPAVARPREEQLAVPIQPTSSSAPQLEPIQPRPVPIERRSLEPLSKSPPQGGRMTRSNAPGATAPATAAAASLPVVEATPQQPAPAVDSSWYDWLVPPPPPAEAVTEADRRFLWPVEGRIISSFGENPNGGRNDGINISVARGTPVRAADSGIVSYVGNELKGYGNLILIRHDNGFVTAYAHADSVHVKRGERVDRGQVIGSAGDTGNVSQPQLHFELRHGTRPVDPTPYLVANSPRNSPKLLAEGTR